MNAEEFRSLLLIVPFVTVTGRGDPDGRKVVPRDGASADVPVDRAMAQGADLELYVELR